MKALIPVLISLGLGLSLQAQTPKAPVKPAVTPSGQPATPVVPKVPAAKPPTPVASPVPTPATPTVPAVVPKVNPVVPGKPVIPGLPGGVILGAKPVQKGPVKGPDAIAAAAGQVIDGSNWDDQDVADEYSNTRVSAFC